MNRWVLKGVGAVGLVCAVAVWMVLVMMAAEGGSKEGVNAWAVREMVLAEVERRLEADVEAEVERRAMEVVERRAAELEKEMRALEEEKWAKFAAQQEEEVERIREFLQGVVSSICEAEYRAITTWSALDALLLYLNDEASIEVATGLMMGVVVDEVYEETSAVCGVDADSRWKLIRQPEMLPEWRQRRVE